MSDPFYLADILLGRVGVLRSTTESVLLDLCEADRKLEGTARKSSSPEVGGLPSAVPLTENESFRAAIKNKLERIQTNLKLLKRLGPEFVAFENKIKNSEEISDSHRNLLLEYHWKYHVQELGEKSQHVFFQGISRTFPRMEELGERSCPPPADPYFIPKSHKRLRMLEFHEKPPISLPEMMKHMAQRNSKLSFGKEVVTLRGGRRVIRSIKCIVNGEMVVYVSFCPPLPESGQSEDLLERQSSSRVSNLEHPAANSGRRMSLRQGQQHVHPNNVESLKQNDVPPQSTSIAEESTNNEDKELKMRSLQLQEQSRALHAGMEISRAFQRISVFSITEDANNVLSAWSESKHQFFRLLSLHARKAFNYFRKHSPDVCFYHFFIWLGYHEKLYQTPCSACKRILNKENEDWLFMPPSFRDYGSGLAFHSKCIVTNQKDSF